MDTIEKLIEAGIYKQGDPLRLHLGCGSNYFADYINIDYSQEAHPVMNVKVDIEADITNDLSFPAGTVHEIRSHHMFEHFTRVVALAQLVKWHYWLKIEGVLIIETPDFTNSIMQLISDGIEYKHQMAIVRHLTGDQSAEWGVHKDQWFMERYESTLSYLGFHITDIKYTEWNRWPQLRNIIVTAMKLNDIKLSDQIEQCFELLEESLVSSTEQDTFAIWKNQLVGLLKGL